jgi:predicted phosphodiesterase
VLRAPVPRTALLERLEGVRRLVLLGDVVELRHGPLREALRGAEPVLRALGEALGDQSEVLLVPGNHDHRLLSRWLERRALDPDPRPMGLESEVEYLGDEPLEHLARCLAPARVTVLYPGVWLRPDVYATHGHYSDRHMTVPIVERVGAGLMARVVREPPGGPHRADDYEAVLGPLYAWIDAVAQSGARGRGGGGLQARVWRALQRPLRIREAGVAASLRGLALGMGFPLTVAALNLARMGPLGSDVSGHELRRAGLKAMGEVLERLEVRADHVIFGHTHRAGPLPGDDRAEWGALGQNLLNTGCWVGDESFLGGDPRRSPYRPGFCAILDDDGPPQLVNVLD